LPFSLDMVVGNSSIAPIPNAKELLAANPKLQDLSSLQVFDATLQSLTDAGLLVILNNHVSRGAWCCDTEDGEGLWYTADFPEEDWLYGLTFIAKRYQNNARVVGFDLRNEIRSSPLGNPDWGSGNPKTDWALAATKAGLSVLEESPELLIIVSGISYSMFLCDVPRHPLHLIVPEFINRTVYTSHEYDWYRSVHGDGLLVAATMCRRYLWPFMVCILSVALLIAMSQMAKGRVLPACCYRRSASCPMSILLVSGLASTSGYVLTIIVGHQLLDGCSDIHMSPALFGVYVVVLGVLWWSSLISISLLLLVPVLKMRIASEFEVDDEESGEVQFPKTDKGELDGPDEQMEAVPALMGSACSPVAGTTSERRLRKFPASRRRLFVPWLAALAMASSMIPMVDFLESYEVFEESLDRRWGFLQGRGMSDEEKLAHPEVAPVWVGEFGTNQNSRWWKHMMRYLMDRPVAGWAYWPVNGEKRPGEDETYGLLMDDMQTIRHPWLLQHLQTLAAGKIAEDGEPG